MRRNNLPFCGVFNVCVTLQTDCTPSLPTQTYTRTNAESSFPCEVLNYCACNKRKPFPDRCFCQSTSTSEEHAHSGTSNVTFMISSHFRRVRMILKCMKCSVTSSPCVTADTESLVKKKKESLLNGRIFHHHHSLNTEKTGFSSALKPRSQKVRALLSQAFL